MLTNKKIKLIAFRNCFALIILFAITVKAQEVINLYQHEIPNSKTIVKEDENLLISGLFRNVTEPTLEIFLPETGKSARAAVIICPGGSYKVIVYEAEGVKTAKEFVKNGVAAFVLKYRIPDDSTMIDKSIGPLQDAQQAIKFVRDNAAKWGVDADKIGIMGFSAGGHLASTAATHFDKAFIENNSKTDLRPNFSILVYPVISMQDSLTHLDSRRNLLGENPTKQVIDTFSNELQIHENTPPTFLIHSGDDNLVDVENSIKYYLELKHNKVPAEMHIYPFGGHGFVLAQPTEEWMKPIFKWMKTNKWINN